MALDNRFAPPPPPARRRRRTAAQAQAADAERERALGNAALDDPVERYLRIHDDGEQHLGIADDGVDRYLGVADNGVERHLGVADDSARYLGVHGDDGSDRYLNSIDESDRYLGVAQEAPPPRLADAAVMVKDAVAGGTAARRHAWYKDEFGRVDPKKLPAGVEYLPSVNRFQYKTWDAKGNIRIRLSTKPPTAKELENMRRRGDISHSIDQLTAPPTGDDTLSEEYWRGVNRGRAHPAGIPTPRQARLPTPEPPVIDVEPTPAKERPPVMDGDGIVAPPPKADASKDFDGATPTPTPTSPERFDINEWRKQKDASLAADTEATPAAETPPPRASGDAFIGADVVAQGVTDPNRSYDLRWRIADLDELRPSHDYRTMDVNPNYDQALQPRDRKRAASPVQIDAIASKLHPKTLIADSGTLDSGAPIVGGDLQVESGNARVMALLKAKAAFPQQYAKYREQLTDPDRLRSLGFNPADIEGVQNPVLVREHAAETPEARRAFVVEANASRVMPMSVPEKAATHADAFADTNLVKIEPNSGMTLDGWLQSNAGNAVAMDFLRALDQNSASSMADAQGNLSKHGLESIENSLFANVYGGYKGGDKLQQELLENTDEDIRRVGTALRDSLPGAARAEAHARSVSKDKSMSIAGDLAAAVQQLRAVRKRGMKVGDYLRSYTADQDLTPTQKKLLAFIGENLGSGKKIREFIDTYNQRVVEQSAPKDQSAMFGGGALGKPQSKDELLDRILSQDFPNPKVAEHLTMLQQKERGFYQSAPRKRKRQYNPAFGATRSGRF